MGYLQLGKEEGATVSVGGGQIGKDGYFVHPTVFTNVKPEMRIMREEIFGPVTAITKFKDEAGQSCLNLVSAKGAYSRTEVIEMANDTLYGLSCAVFTENSARAHRVAHAIEAGTIWVCRC